MHGKAMRVKMKWLYQVLLVGILDQATKPAKVTLLNGKK